MAQADTLEIVSFVAGACHFAVEARQVEALLSDGPQTMVAVESLLGLPLLEAAPPPLPAPRKTLRERQRARRPALVIDR